MNLTGWQLPFAILSLQWAGIGFLWHRNVYIDRQAICLVFSIGIQEILQVLLWMFAINDNTTLTECSLFNQILSNSIMILMFLFPLMQLKFASKTAFYNELFRSDNIRRVSLKLLIFLYYIWYIFCVTIRIYNQIKNKQAICIFEGKSGQQNWSSIIYVNGLMNTHYGYKLLIHSTNILYLLPSILLFIIYRPLWVIFCHSFVTIGSFIILYYIYGIESFSMWSMVSLFNVVWIVLSPHIAKCMVNQGMISFHNPSKLLYGSHGHLIQHDMLQSDFEFADQNSNIDERQCMLD